MKYLTVLSDLCNSKPLILLGSTHACIAQLTETVHALNKKNLLPNAV